MDSFSSHLWGAIGECAVAKGLREWPSLFVDEFRGGAADLASGGRGLEVRHGSKSDSSLIIREGDIDDRTYILSRGQPPVIEVVGWIKAKDAKQDKWKASHGEMKEAYFIPAEELYPIEFLPPH